MAWRSGVVERAERLLAAVEVGDRDALERRGERRRGGLEPVADEQQGVGRRRAEVVRDRLQGRGRLDVGRRVVAGRRARRARRRLEAVGADELDRRGRARAERCMPPDDEVAAGASGSSRIAAHDRAEDAPVLAAGA